MVWSIEAYRQGHYAVRGIRSFCVVPVVLTSVCRLPHLAFRSHSWLIIYVCLLRATHENNYTGELIGQTMKCTMR